MSVDLVVRGVFANQILYNQGSHIVCPGFLMFFVLENPMKYFVTLLGLACLAVLVVGLSQNLVAQEDAPRPRGKELSRTFIGIC